LREAHDVSSAAPPESRGYHPNTIDDTPLRGVKTNQNAGRADGEKGVDPDALSG
jgi:hypothetical protein